jgi:hypothetical protein
MDFLGYGKESIFYSSLTIEDCVKTLNSSVRKKKPISLGYSENYDDVVCKINGDKFHLFINKGLIPANSAYNPVFYGKLVNIGGGTTIKGYFNLSTSSAIITALIYLWMTGLPLFLDAPIWVTLLCFSFTSLTTMINMLWGKREMGPILEFIQRELQAIPVTS